MKNSYRSIILCFLMIFILNNVSAQKYENFSGQISGKIIDAETKNPVEYVIVTLYTADSVISSSLATDDAGRFKFIDIREGSYYIKTDYISYKAMMINNIVINKKDSKHNLNALKIEPIINELENVEVNSEKYTVEYRPDKQIVNVDKQIHADGGTAADALQTISSVQVDAAGNVTLRGSSDFLLLIDGRPTITDASTVLSQMQANTIKQIEVITNPSVKYEAEGNTGIINIITKKTYLKSYEANLNLSVATENKFSGSLSINKQLGKHQIYGGISYSDKTKVNVDQAERESDISSDISESNLSVRAVTIFSTNAKLGGDFKLTDKDDLSIYGEIGIWRFNRLIDSEYEDFINTISIISKEDFMNENKFMQTGILYKHNFTKEHTLSFDFNYHFIRNSIPDTYTIQETDYFQEINNNSVRNRSRFKIDYTLPINKKHKFEMGLFYTDKTSDYDYSFLLSDIRTDSEQSFSYDEFAGYLLYSTTLKEINFQIGLRAENDRRNLMHNGESYNYKQFNLFPSLHLSRSFKKKHHITLGYSRRINRPSEWQISPLINSSDHFLTRVGNPYLLSEFTHSGEFNYHYRGKSFNTGVQLFYRSINDQISSFTLFEGGQFYESYDNLDHAANTGIELSVGYQAFKRLGFQIAGSSYYSDWEGDLNDGNIVADQTITSSGNFRTTLLLGKQTYIQFLAVYYAPGKIYQGTIDAFYYFDFIVKQHFLKKKLNVTLRTHNTFDTGLLRYTTIGEGYSSENRYRYEGPTVILSLSYTLNNFKRKRSENVDFEFDSGLDN